MPGPAGPDDMRLDALFTILEKHLYDFEDNEDSEVAFIEKIVGDYLSFLTTQRVVVPRRFAAQITDELRDQVRKMLVKKMYGCLSIEEYVMKQRDRASKLKVARKKYAKLF